MPTGPGSTDGEARRWRDFSRVLALASAALLALGSGWVAYVDPLWIYRETPPWLAWTGGANRLLDAEMRRAKPFQLFSRPAATVLIGSSVVYRGLDGAGLPGGAYNFGVSALLADELPTVARLVAARGGVERVAIGLDFYMFTSFPVPTRMAPGLDGRATRLMARLRAPISLRTLGGSMPFIIGSAYEGGAWRFDGFKTTTDYAPATTRRIAAAQEFEPLAYRPDLMARLDEALAALESLDVRIYLSPVSAAQRALLARAGRDADLRRWRADAASTAARRGRPFRDLSRLPDYDDFDPERGSSRFWFDNLHFKPELGRRVLDEIGFTLPQQPPATTREGADRPRPP